MAAIERYVETYNSVVVFHPQHITLPYGGDFLWGQIFVGLIFAAQASFVLVCMYTVKFLSFRSLQIKLIFAPPPPFLLYSIS